MQVHTVENVLNAAHTVTVTLSGSVATTLYLWIVHLAGVANTSPLATEAYGTTNDAGSVNAGNGTTSTDDGILLSFCMLESTGRTISVPTGFTVIPITSGTRGKGAYKEVSAADTYAAVWNWTGGNSKSIAIHEAYLAEPVIIVATRIPFDLVNTRAFNHGFQS